MPKPTQSDYDALAKTSYDVRDAAWRAWGTLEPAVLTHILNPSLVGGPRWPGMRQAYRIARHNGAVLIASDGLSDPYDPGEGPNDVNGLELEVFAVTDDKIAREGIDDPVQNVGATWLHNLVYQAAQLAAHHGGITSLIDELGALTLELFDISIPATHEARFINDRGTVTVLMTRGATPIPTVIAGPLSPIRLVHLQMLTVEELAFVMARGDDGRHELIARLQEQHVAPLSRLDRPSVV